jgi:predicted secreted hydrolase
VPRDEVSAAPLGTIREHGGGLHVGGWGGGIVELPSTRKISAIANSNVTTASSQSVPRPNLTLSLSKGEPARTASGFLNARVPWRFSFPRDHAAHFGFASEWWYYTGHLRAADGRSFGYELTFFRFGLRPGDPKPVGGQSQWRGNQVYPAHLAITDENGKKFVYFERFAREALGMGRGSDIALDVASDDWSLRGSAPFRMRAFAEGVGVDLVQVAEKAPAVHGHDGISVKGACGTCASHYYSMTRLRTRGMLAYGGARLRVDGLTWMDHEFGSDELQPNQAGWDWFSIQLDDRREIMEYRLRQNDGALTPESSGSLVDARGGVRYLRKEDVLVDARGTWVSPHTGGRYPSGWHVRVPSAQLDLVLVPTVLDQELAGLTGGVAYWEGAVDVRDAASGRHAGVGYVELTGYAGAIPR